MNALECGQRDLVGSQRLFESFIAESCLEMPQDILYVDRPLEKVYCLFTHVKLSKLLYATVFGVQKTAYLFIHSLAAEHVHVKSLGVEMGQQEGKKMIVLMV
jgi:hypothetical protein